MDPDRLKTIPLFSSLSEKALDTVSVFASETSVSTGKRLVHEGDYSYDLIVIETGTADVIKGGEVIGSLGPGDVFGEMGMLSGGKRIGRRRRNLPDASDHAQQMGSQAHLHRDQRPAAVARRAAPTAQRGARSVLLASPAVETSRTDGVPSLAVRPGRPSVGAQRRAATHRPRVRRWRSNSGSPLRFRR